MTTAHRPTFDTARGGTGKNEGDLSKLSQQYSSKDMPSHTKLKYRQSGQSSTSDVRSKDFRAELEEKEQRTSANKERRSKESTSSSSSSNKRVRLEASSSNVDADDPLDEDDDEEESDDEDDTAELMAELSRIKRERAGEKAKQEAKAAEEEERIRTENILFGNPLLNEQRKPGGASSKQDFTVKRRWDDDVVFKNCAKGISEHKEIKFVNDAIRSEFHKKFMEKYIK